MGIRISGWHVIGGGDPCVPNRALSGDRSIIRHYHVDDLRIIVDIERGRLQVLAIEIGNRREVYR